MTLVIDNGSNPGVHALIIGVSDYPDLPSDPADRLPRHHGMCKLSSAALSAYNFFRWVERSRDLFPVPLATCRLLLSPSAEELQVAPGMDGLAERATLDGVQREAAAWRENARRGKENMTLFYFAGHGVHRNSENAVLLLEGFGSGIGGPLVPGFDLSNVRAGMGPSGNQDGIARKQWYFIDACRNLPEAFDRFTELNPTQIFGPEFGTDDRSAPTLYASAAGDGAIGLRRQGSVFSNALIECLEGDAGDLVEIDHAAKWVVSLFSLSKAMKVKYEDIGKALDEDVFIDPSGASSDIILCGLRRHPEAELVFTVDPATEVGITKFVARNGDPGIAPLPLPHPLDPHPHRIRVPAGMYTISVSIDPPDPTRTVRFAWNGVFREVLPPRVPARVKVERVEGVA